MNEFYQEDKLFNQQLINQNDNEDKNNIDTNGFPIQITQHWKPKSLDDQPSLTSNLSNEISSCSTDKNSNKNELSTITDESEKSIVTMKKREKPVPSSYIRRRPNLKYGSSNGKLLPPNKLANKTITSGKKSMKSTPVFIPPKKISPQPHSFSSLSFDDSLQMKRKPILERQTAIVDDHYTSSMTNWAPSTSPAARFYVQSSGSSFEDNSSDESDHESLLIRKKSPKIKKPRSSVQTPVTIFITDPYGHSSTLDPDNDTRDKSDHKENNTENDSNPNDTNTLFPDSKFDVSSPPDIIIIPSTPPLILDKHTLHSIGEEEEDDDNNNNKTETNENNQLNVKVQNEDSNQNDKEPLSRRWSDGITNQTKEQIPSSKSSLMKMPSAASVIKPIESPPVKISRTKYLLMKLHLTSSNKDDESNNSTPKKRTVRRAPDKKRYQTQ
jgi:hypothetical protein